ncbi:hypothetical protein [Mucilaginibacter segetis]|uniref:DUF4412 domain-containing protein n=1 Tax=Mucilaginibacter segetis TaxID=2793071 RepID=A0A934PQX2_9SPHI|nr:hypothetical protein [Mucilaginibacter segetis]MBK0379113.1 hypothetical protein [Mucilaginibacter segetis]
MKIKLFTVALGMVLSATAITASAQKKIDEGVATFDMNMQGQSVEAKHYFTKDSSAVAFSAGPANIRVISDAGFKYYAVIVDVPVASIEKAAIAKPAEVEEVTSKFPVLTFAPTTETKVISGFNCKKVVATDTKTNKTYDIWVTNDISVPSTGFSKYYEKIGGYPVQFTTFQDGQTSEVTVKSVTAEKAPAGTFGIPAGFDKITLDDLKAMSGGGR